MAGLDLNLRKKVMTREEIEMMVSGEVEKIRREHRNEVQVLSDRIPQLEGALEHLRKNFLRA